MPYTSPVCIEKQHSVFPYTTKVCRSKFYDVHAVIKSSGDDVFSTWLDTWLEANPVKQGILLGELDSEVLNMCPGIFESRKSGVIWHHSGSKLDSVLSSSDSHLQHSCHGSFYFIINERYMSSILLQSEIASVPVLEWIPNYSPYATFYLGVLLYFLEWKEMSLFYRQD